MKLATKVRARRAMSSRGTVIVACAAVALATALVLAGTSWPIVLSVALTEGLFVLLWVVAAAGWGAFVVARVRSIETPALRFVTSVALGLGIISLLVLVLGLVGAMSRVVAWGIVLVGIASLLVVLRASMV